MKRAPGRRSAIRAILLVLGAALPLLPAGALPPEEPWPLVRKVVAAERVAEELERARQGVLVRLSRADFEARVKEAAQASVPREPPRLVKARYRAELDRGALVGRGDWTVINPDSGPGILPLAELRLPLQNVKVEGTEAILGDLDGKTQGLWVDKSGQQTVAFDWSLRGSLGIGEVHFDLQLPAAAFATLELTLPADYQVTVPRNTVILTGPDFAGRADQRLWQVSFPGRSRFTLVLRRLAGPGAVPPLVLASMRARQQLLQDRVLAEYRVGLEVLHQPVRELIFDCDPLLRPTEVSSASLPLKDWQVQPAGGSDGGPRLVVRFREAIQGPFPPFPLQIVCEAPLPTDGPWVSPGLRLRNAVIRGETLEVRVLPDVDLQGWSNGGFRLLQAKADPDGSQVLTLSGGGTTAVARPGGHVKATTVAFSVKQTVWWHIDPKATFLTVDLSYEVVRGRLFRLGLRLPPGKPNGWQVEGVELVEPKGLPHNWVTATNQDKRSLLVELQRSLPAGQRARLVVRLRAPIVRGAGATAAVALPFPEVVPLTSCPLAGVLGISADPLYRIQDVRASAPASSPGGPGPWGKAPLQFHYEFRDRPPTGQLRLLPHRAVLHAVCRNELVLAAPGASSRVYVTLDPVIGAPQAVDLYVSAGPQSGWKWKPVDSRGGHHRLDRLPARDILPQLLALGGAQPFGRLACLAAPAQGSYWRLLLAQPLARRETFTLEMSRDLDPRANLVPQRDWDVPLVTIPGADRLQGQAVVQLVGAEVRRVEAEGIQESGQGGPGKRTIAGGLGQDTWRNFRFGYPSPGQLPRLRIQTRPLPAAADPREVCDYAHLTTRLDPDGRLVHFFTFHLRGWRSHTLPVGLPGAVKVLAAQVEDRWIDRLAQKETQEGVEVMLPVPGHAGALRYHLVYTSVDGPPSWAPWVRLQAPLPRMPVQVMALRRTWQLPPGRTPLGPGARRLPLAGAPRQEGAWQALLKKGWHAGDFLVAAAGPPFALEDWGAQQRRILEDAESALHKKQGIPAGGSLGPTLERLVLDYLRDALPLVVDAAALRAAGIGPATHCPATQGARPFWDALGLVPVPCRSGTLLTTVPESDQWQARTGKASLEDDAIDEAVRQALRHGHDPSGRFWDAKTWARTGAQGTPTTAALDQAQPLFGGHPGAGWSEWEPVAGARPEDVLVVASQQGIEIVGLVLAGVLLVLASRVRGASFGRWRLRLLLAWLGVSAVALLWLPEPLRPGARWPALAGLAVAVAWYLRRPRKARRPREPGSALPGAAMPAALVLALIALWPVSLAQGPAADTVLILPGAAGSPSQQAVLVTPNLLQKLAARSRRGSGLPTEAVLLSARYEGTVTAAAAELRADFQVYCSSDKAIVTIPLANVDLKEGALLEGAFVYPAALPGPQAGYTVAVTGRKGQVVKLSLPFRVRLSASGDNQDLRFHIPRLAQSQLELTLPDRARLAQAVTALGQQLVSREAGAPPRLRASLGFADFGSKDSSIHAHWRLAGGPLPPPVAEVSEFYLWDLRPPTSDLTAVLKYNVTAGAVAELAIDLPEGIEVRGVEATPQAVIGAAKSQARLADWELSARVGKRRRLTLRLSEPVTGVLQVTLGLVPRATVAPGALALVLPTPVRPAGPNEKVPAGLLAYRIEGLEAADRPHHLGVINIPFAQFVRQWQELGLRDLPPVEGPTPAGRAYSFRRTLPGSALELTLTATPPVANSLVKWRAASGYLDMDASVRLVTPEEATGPKESLMLLEWEVPAVVTVAGVSGPDVFRWGRSGARLQVWLREPRQEAAVRLTGWIKPLPGGPGKLVLPGVRLLWPRPTKAEVRVRATAGVLMEETALANLKPTAAAGRAPFSYEAVDPAGPYSGTFRLLPAAREAEARSLTLLEARAGTVTFTSRLQVDLPPGDARNLMVWLRGWPGQVRLEGAGRPAREQPRQAGEHAWKVRVDPTGLPHYSLKLSGRVALPAAGLVFMPEVTVTGALLKERWLAVLGNDLKVAEAHGLVLIKDAAAELHRWPVDAELIRREGTAWQLRAANWKLALAQRAALGRPSVKVVLAEQSAAALDGEHWLHEGVYTLFVEGGDGLRVELPEGARFLGATVDGSAAVPRPAGAGMLLLPLPAEPGAHTLRLRWQLEPGRESLSRPRLEPPHLRQVGDYPVLWNVVVPPGYHLPPQSPGLVHTAASPARLELERASAQIELMKQLRGRQAAGDDQDFAEQFQAAHTRLLRHLRRADGDLLKEERAEEERGPKGQTLAAWLEDLRRQANALASRKAGVLASPATVETARSGLALASVEERGTPIGWRTSSGERPPAPRLQPLTAWQDRQALIATELLLGVLLGMWILSHLPRLTAWLRGLWPEQLFLLALAGWQPFGPSLVGVVLVLLAACARLFALGLWLQRWRRTPARTMTTAT